MTAPFRKRNGFYGLSPMLVRPQASGVVPVRRTPTTFYVTQDFGVTTSHGICCQGTSRSVSRLPQPQPKPDLHAVYHPSVSGTVTTERRKANSPVA